MPKQKENTERINVFFTKETVDKLRQQASEKGMTVSGLIRFIVLDYLKD